MQVVRHGGISNAAKAGAGDLSSLSKLIKGLETALCTTLLLQRVPFRLLRHGRIYLSGLEQAREARDTALDHIWTETRPTLQLISAEVVTLCYFPNITRELGRKHPNLQCSTESGGEEQIQRLLRDGDVNLAIAPEHEGWRGFQRAPLLELRPVLICPERMPYQTAKELWALPEPPAPLLVSAASDTVTRSFNAGLKGLGVKWPERRRVASALCVSQQVAEGDGFGLTVDVPNLRAPSGNPHAATF
jgi:DNA-binding transcriptional LysR family regulator